MHATHVLFKQTGSKPAQVVTVTVQLPLASQPCTTLPLHRVCPGAQLPMQAPPTQVLPEAVHDVLSTH